jgi:AcrR family transcriptional regulator
MKPKAPDSRKYQQQKLAAVRAAATLFAEKGFHGASTQDIAHRLGLKQGSLYYYFSSKEEALEEVCLYGLQAYLDNMETIAKSEEPFQAKLFAVVTNHLTSYREKSEALKVFNDERLYLPEARRVRLKERGSRYRQLLEAIFSAGVAAGEVNENIDAHFAAQSVIGICNGLGELLIRDEELDVFDLIRKCTELLLHGTQPAR